METPRGSKLVHDHLRASGEIRRFLPADPDSEDDYRAKAREVDERFSAGRREELAGWISAPTPESRERLDRWKEEGGYFVTTGQQPGLFGGPLYTVYKALSAVARARTLEDRLERPVLPLFWIASEDHDWEEASRTWIVDVDNELSEVAVARPKDASEAPLHRISLGSELTRALSDLESRLPSTDFSAEFLELLRSAYPEGATLADGFRRLMAQLLGPFGLCFLEAHQADLKEASLPLLIRELEEAEEVEVLLRRRARELEEAGYEVQVPILEGGVNVFLEGPAGRERLYRDDGGFRLRTSGARRSLEDIARCAESDPTVLSPNVLLRPLVEATLLPTVSYVAGPGETAYFAQLSEYFDLRGVAMPVVAPRSSMTVVEAKNRKVLEKFDLDVRDLDRPFHELASEVAREEMPAGLQRIFGELRRSLDEGSSALLDEVQEVDPTLRGTVKSARSTCFQSIDEVEKKVVQAVKRQDDIAMQQLEKAQVHLFPRGIRQERVLNVFYYLVRYGGGFLPEVADRCAVDLGGRPL